MAEGSHGAGTGARVGGLKGGVGTASTVLPDGTTVGALAVVNAVGSAVDPDTGELWAARHCVAGDLPGPPSATTSATSTRRRQRAAEQPEPRPPLATTLIVLATDTTLTKAQCQKVGGIGHDGLARAINPVHTMYDGDTVFTLATGSRPAPTRSASTRCSPPPATPSPAPSPVASFTAESAAGMRGYRDAFPSAFV